MSERGVFAVDRGIWDHPSFDDEPFTQREAWAWLCGEAAYKPHRKRVGKIVVDLKRGQLAASVRFMAEKWGWLPAKAQRFLERMKIDTMVSVDATRGISVITICNYNKYQKVSLPKDTPTGEANDTPPIQQRYKVESTESTEVVDDGGLAPAKSAFTVGSKALADALWKALGFASPLDITPRYAGTDWRAVEWERAGWTPEIITAEVARAGPDKPLSYYEKCFATAFAKLCAPLPKVEIREAETLQVTHAPNRGKSGNIVDAFARLEEQVRAGNRGEASADVVRLLPSR